MKLKMLLTAAVFLACALTPEARASSLITEVIGMFPQNSGEFAYADLRQARNLAWFPQLQEQMLPARFRQFQQFLASAGLDPDSQVEELAWAFVPAVPSAGAVQNSAVPARDEVVGVALGTFMPDKVEAYFKAHKLAVVNVHDYSLYAFDGGSGGGSLFVCFIDSNTAAFGERKQLERLIAVRYGEEQNLLSNAELAPFLAQANGGDLLWSVMTAPYARLAMKQLAPQTAEFPQAQELLSKLGALTLEISTGSSIQTKFEAECGSPDGANALAALLEAGLLYQRYQVADSNPDLAAMLDQTEVVPWGDRLDVTSSLTNDQLVALIQRHTFVLHP